MDDLDRWGPTRPVGAHRGRPGGRGQLTSEQKALADELHVRALAIRAATRGGISIREAVDLAAVELGLELPQTPTESEED